MDVTFESPAFQEAEAVRLAAELYGLQVSAEPLPSESDRNFLLTAATGDRFVLKIANAGDDPAVIDLQNAALHRIGTRTAAVRVPQVRPARDGALVAAVRAADGAPHLARLLEWVPERVLAQARPHTPELLRSLGAAVAHVDRALEGFDHPQYGQAEKQIAVCIDCHGVHDIMKVKSANASVVKQNLTKRCQKCHPGATTNFPDSWISHYEPNFKKAPLVFLIDVGYRIFIPFMIIGLLVQIVLHLWRYAVNR